jgi:hypothetical protein
MMTRLLDRLWARPHILPTEEVARRLSSYMTPTIVNDLYDFGQLLLNEGFSRKSQLESKATVVVGYSGAILAYLLARLPRSASHSISNWATIPALLALVFGFAAARVHLQNWLSDDIWVPEELSSIHPEEQLRLHYFEALYEVNEEMKRANQRKGNFLFFAQWLLLLAVLTVAGALLIEWSKALSIAV